MATTCLNCGKPLLDQFCPHCGQKAEVHRLNLHNLREEIIYVSHQMAEGFIKTVKQLILQPGTLCKNYLDGKRKRYYKPVSFLLVWITAFLLIFQAALYLTDFPPTHTSTLFTFDVRTSSIISKYRSLFEVLTIPFLAFTSWLIIARPRLNYVEVLIVFFYLTSFLFIILCGQVVIALLLDINFRTNNFDLSTKVVYSAWLLYAGYTFYRQYNIPFLIPRIILSQAISGFIYFNLIRLFVDQMIIWHLA